MNSNENSRSLSLRTVAIVASAGVGALLLSAVVALWTTPSVAVAPESSFSKGAASGPGIEVAPEATPEPTPNVESGLYPDCEAVWVALSRPITANDEGFPESSPNKFDLDSDGIGCEDDPRTEADESEIDWQAIWVKTEGNARDFGLWAADELGNLWGEVAPWLSNTLDRASELINPNR